MTELETFVQKFHQLWNAGHNAHLDAESHAGAAWVGLRVQLGQAPGHQHHHQVNPQKKFSPSRQRHHVRRAAEQNVNLAESADIAEASDKVVEEAAIN